MSIINPRVGQVISFSGCSTKRCSECHLHYCSEAGRDEIWRRATIVKIVSNAGILYVKTTNSINQILNGCNVRAYDSKIERMCNV